MDHGILIGQINREAFMYIIYEQIISDVAMEISIMQEWRREILKLKEGEFLEISYLTPNKLPEYIKNDIIQNKLTFYVEKVDKCPEEFDEGLIIFKFWSKEYPEICSFSGNNPYVI